MTLLHLITPPVWRAALAVGAVRPTVAEFVHLSQVEQVALPANRLYANRPDLYLLAIDPDRLDADVRWEPGEPTDPSSMRFPHAYGPIPTTAVLAVLPYRPGPDGVFTEPTLPPLYPAARAALLPLSVLRRTATSEVPVSGGVAVRTEPVPFSYQHNIVLIEGPVDAATVAADADAVQVGFDHRAVQLFGDALADTAAGLAALGWAVDEQIGMIARPRGASTGRVEQLDLAGVRPLWDAAWRVDLPNALPERRAQLSERYAYEEPIIDQRYLAARDGGAVVAGAVLRIDGATAMLDAVGTDPAHRGRGHADAVVAEALSLAAAAGCDVIGLDADAQDWPRRWYGRRGFAEVSRNWFATRPAR